VTAQFTAIHGEHEARMMVLELLSQAAERVGLSIRKVMSDERAAPYVQARHWAMYEAFHRGCTEPQIGRVLDLDASTVHHGVKAETDRRLVAEKRLGIPVFRSIRAIPCP